MVNLITPTLSQAALLSVFGIPFSSAQHLFRPVSKPELFVKGRIFCDRRRGLSLELTMAAWQFSSGGLPMVSAYFLLVTDSFIVTDMLDHMV